MLQTITFFIELVINERKTGETPPLEWRMLQDHHNCRTDEKIPHLFDAKIFPAFCLHSIGTQ